MGEVIADVKEPVEQGAARGTADPAVGTSVQPAEVQKGMIRIIADLPVGTVEILRGLAESQQISLVDALRRAIADESLLLDKVEKGKNRVLLESKDGRLTELLWTR